MYKINGTANINAIRAAAEKGITSECAIPMDSSNYVPISKRAPVTAQVVIGTPGTINKWATTKKLSTNYLKILVFDEANHMLAEAQIMLEMVTPQMLQMPNIWQASGQPLSQDGQQGQQPVVQTLPGLPPLAQNKMQFGLMPRVQEGQISSLHPNSLAHSQYSALPQLPTHPQVKLPQLPLNQVLQQGTLPGHFGISVLPSIRPLLVVFVFILQNFSRMDDFEMKLPHMFFQPVRMATVDHILQSTSAIKDYLVHCLKIRVASCNLLQSCPPVTNVQAFLLSVARSLFQQIIYAHRKFLSGILFLSYQGIAQWDLPKTS